MLIEDIKTGTKLKLEVYDYNDKKIDKPLVTQFEYSEGNEYVIFQAPIYEGVIYPMIKGTFMHVLFSDDEKLYCFSARAYDDFLSNGLRFIKVKVLGEIRTIQRRNDYRFRINLEILYRKIKLEGLEFKPLSSEFIATRTKNISGGGVCILLNEEVEVNTHLECTIEIEKDLNIRFIGRIVRFEKNDDNSLNYKYKAGMAYDIIDSNDREKIVRFIFREQLELRRKGII